MNFSWGFVMSRVIEGRNGTKGLVMNSDQELLRQIRAGNEKAFEALVLRYQDVVYRLALRQLGDRETAGEAVQEVFLRAWTKLRHWSRGRGKLFTWLYRTTRNVCHELHRRRRRDPLCSWDFDKDPIPMSEHCRESEEEDYCRVQRLVRELPPRQEQVVWLHIFEGLQLKEVAVVLGIPIGTVKSNYHKALGNLRKAWLAIDPKDVALSSQRRGVAP